MKIDDYMKAKGFKPPSLAAAINQAYGTRFSKTSIYRIMDGGTPSLELAVAIDLFTDGEVKPIDLLTNSVLVGSVLCDGTPVDAASTVIWDQQGIGVAIGEEDFSDLFDEL